MRYNTQISAEVPAPTATEFPRYSTCPLCGDQLYLSRTHYLCRDSISCGYTISAQLHAETLALSTLAPILEAPKTPEEIEVESRDYDALQAAYDRKASQLDRAHTSRRPNSSRIQRLSAELDALRVQLMREAA